MTTKKTEKTEETTTATVRALSVAVIVERTKNGVRVSDNLKFTADPVTPDLIPSFVKLIETGEVDDNLRSLGDYSGD